MIIKYYLPANYYNVFREKTENQRGNCNQIRDRYLCNGLSGNKSRPSLILLLGDGETSLMPVIPVSNTFADKRNSIVEWEWEGIVFKQGENKQKTFQINMK